MVLLRKSISVIGTMDRIGVKAMQNKLALVANAEQTEIKVTEYMYEY